MSARQTRCGLPTSTATPAKTRALQLGRRHPAQPRRAHLDGDVAARRHVGHPDATPGVKRQPARRCPAGIHQVSGEHPRAVPTHLCQRTVGVAVVHDESGRAPCRAGRDPDHAVGAEPGMPVAERPDLGRGDLEAAVGVGQQDEVVLGAVTLDERDPLSGRAPAGSSSRRQAYGGGRREHGHRPVGQSRQARVQLDHPLVATEPGTLPADETPGRRGGRGDGVVEVCIRRPARRAAGRSRARATR